MTAERARILKMVEAVQTELATTPVSSVRAMDAGVAVIEALEVFRKAILVMK